MKWITKKRIMMNTERRSILLSKSRIIIMSGIIFYCISELLLAWKTIMKQSIYIYVIIIIYLNQQYSNTANYVVYVIVIH